VEGIGAASVIAATVSSLARSAAVLVFVMLATASSANASERLTHSGLNTWYLAPNGQSRGVLKVRHGLIEEIGIVDKRLTQPRRAASTFLNSFW
jgi:hypothetical protein